MRGRKVTRPAAVKAFVKRTVIVVAIFTAIGIATGVHDMVTNPQPPVVDVP